MMLLGISDPWGIKLALLLLIAFILPSFFAYRSTNIDMLFLLLGGFTWLSCIMSINLIPSLLIAYKITTCILGYIILRNILKDKSSYSFFLHCLGVLAGIAIFLSLCTFVIFRHSVLNSGFEELYSFRFLFKPAGYNINVWATILIILSSFFLINKSINTWLNLIYQILFGLTIFAACLSFSRGVFISVGIFVILLVIFLPLIEKVKLLVIVLTVGGTLFYLYPQETLTTLRMNYTNSQRQSTQGRIDSTKFIQTIWKNHTFWGVGSGNYTLAIDKGLNQDTTKSYTSYAPNIIAHILIENGIIGIILYISLMLCIIKTIWDKRKSNTCIVIGCTLVSILVKEMTLSTLLDTQITLFLTLILLAIVQRSDETMIEDTNIHNKLSYKIILISFIVEYTCVEYVIYNLQKSDQLNFIAWENFKKGDTTKAISTIKNSRNTLPNQINKSILYMESAKYSNDRLYLDMAKAELEDAKKNQPEDIHIYYLQAKLATIAQNRTLAITILMDLVKNYPQNALYQYELYKLLYANKQKAKALIHLKIAIQILPRILNLENIKIISQTDPAFHHTLITQLLAKRPISENEPIVLAQYGYIAYHSGNMQDAEQYLSQAVSKLPNLSIPWILLHKINQKTGNTVYANICLKRYKLLTYGAFSTKLLSSDNEDIDIVGISEKFLLKNYAMKFQSWYGIKLFI
ncbi:O-antigen ligase family protein [Bacteroides sp.]|uniref:O-antigen ligase family protein n=1 Tax=Bacteroides sp. TaxID=29523 RepID=UPI0026130636|nr:O-antigen ligase family protein [Bacteroides sp.]